jgi:hypothetical protein
MSNPLVELLQGVLRDLPPSCTETRAQFEEELKAAQKGSRVDRIVKTLFARGQFARATKVQKGYNTQQHQKALAAMRQRRYW